MRRWIVVLLVAMVAITNSGCWNRRELDTLAVVMAFGIDRAKEDGKIKLTVQVLNPGEIRAQAAGGASSHGDVWIFTSTGHTVFDAFRNATMQSERKLFISHNKIIVIGEEMARSGIRPLIDVFDRDPEPRRLSSFLVAKGEAKDIIEAEQELERIPAVTVENLVNAYGATSMAVKVTLHEFLKMLASKTTDPVASRIEIIAEEELEKKEEQEDSSKGGEAGEGNPKKRVRLTGAAVFRGDKLAGWLNRPETRGLNWILGRVKSGIIVVKSPKDETQYVSLEVIKASSKIIPGIEGGEVVITVEVEEEGNLGEQMSDAELTKPEAFRSLERRQAEVIENEIRSVLEKAQKEMGADIFGFGEAVHRKFPKEWRYLEKRWRDEFPELEVRIRVNASLQEVGLSTTPVEIEGE